MWKKIICILFLPTFLYAKINGNRDHLAQLKEKFPYALLGDDYGLLTVNDLAINACGRFSKPFDPDTDEPKSSLYWQCFESKTISFDCEEFTSDIEKGLLGLISMSVKENKVQNYYIERRPWPIQECKQFIKDAVKLIKGTKYTCISGSSIDIEKDSAGLITKSWTIERFKTRKGCKGRDCEFTKKFKQNRCPNLQF